MVNKVNLIFRRKGKGVSIEELFSDISKILKRESNFKLHSYKVLHNKITVLNIVKNILYVNKIKGLIHITGDIHYVAINPLKKTILTIHDLGSILKGNNIELFIKKIWWFWLPSIFVSRITVISEFSKSELLEIIPWAKKKVTVIHNPVNSTLELKPKKFNKEMPTILHLGTKENKNLENTILGLRNIPCNLIIVGKLNQFQLQCLQSNKMIFKNYVDIPYAKIKELYEVCDIVSFISKYEGFGMPIVEAQKVGRIVITSDKASIPEVAGKGAHFVDPESSKEIETGFLKIISNDTYRQHLIKIGIENVKRFEITEISKKYYEIYNNLKV